MNIGDRVITIRGNVGDIVKFEEDNVVVQDYLSRQTYIVPVKDVHCIDDVACPNCDSKGCDFCGPELTIRESVV